jgi:hypothetical protein
VRELERFVAFGGLADVNLLRRLERALAAQHPTLLEETLAAADLRQSGLDADGDGIREEYFVFNKGKLWLWMIDSDQDGANDIQVFFSAETGFPVRVMYPAPGADMSCDYTEYPYIGETRYYEGPAGKADRVRLSRILPGELSLPIVAGKLPAAGIAWLNYTLNGEALAFPREKAEKAAYVYEETIAAQPDFRQDVFLDKGKVRQIDIVYVREPFRMPNRAGSVPGAGERLVVLVVHRLMFEGGKFSYGLRDLDRVGIFDVREQYHPDGKLSAVFVDTDGDGKKDYIEGIMDPLTPVILKYWDTDGDGMIDAEEIRSGEKTSRNYDIPFDRYYGRIDR